MRRITQVLSISRLVEGEPDIYGNPRESWESVDWPVYAVAPRVQQEPAEANRSAVFTGVTVYAPVDGPRPGPNDRVTVSGEVWEVTGDVGVWDNNPHFTTTTQRGIVVNLDRTEG